MYIDIVPNRKSPPAVLLRESRREGKKTIKSTIANLSHWPPQQIEALRRVLKGETFGDGNFEILRAKPHGHIAAVYGSFKRCGLEHLLAAKPSRQRDLVAAMIVARITEPGSKLATARGLDERSLASSLSEVLQLGDIDVSELYDAMDWLVQRQARIENAFAQRHLTDGTLVLYDVTSSYFEGTRCPLAKYGHNRDGKRGKLQIVIGLLCNADGCPVSVQVFDGNTGDPTTLAAQVAKVRERFGLTRVVFVGDRGMLTTARIQQELAPAEGLDWISALRAPAIRKLVEEEALQLSLFDQQNLVEITSEDFPGERLIVCRNPFLAEQRARSREELLAMTERELAKIKAAVERPRKPLRGKDAIGLRVGKHINRYKMAKHFTLEIEEDRFDYGRKQEQIEAEAALDGLYVIRTSVEAEVLDSQQTVGAYKGLSQVERAFRSMKTVDLKVRPIYHRLEQRVRSHVLLCMLAYYVEWHMRQALAPMLFDDEHKEQAQALRDSVVEPAQQSASALRKKQKQRHADGTPVHSFQTLLNDLKTLTLNHVCFNGERKADLIKYATPTPLQQRVLDLLGVAVKCTQ